MTRAARMGEGRYGSATDATPSLRNTYLSGHWLVNGGTILRRGNGIPAIPGSFNPHGAKERGVFTRVDRPARNRKDRSMANIGTRAATRRRKTASGVLITQPERTAEFAALLGDPQKAMEEMRQFKESARMFEADYDRFLDEYEGRWIAMHDGSVIADALTLDLLLEKVESEYPEKRRSLFARFMDREPQLLIL